MKGRKVELWELWQFVATLHPKDAVKEQGRLSTQEALYWLQRAEKEKAASQAA